MPGPEEAGKTFNVCFDFCMIFFPLRLPRLSKRFQEARHLIHYDVIKFQCDSIFSFVFLSFAFMVIELFTHFTAATHILIA